jgi:hypothetical protein
VASGFYNTFPEAHALIARDTADPRRRKMTPATFRKLALQLPGACEGEHMSHADFRVGGKIFATLGYPTGAFAVILLSPEEQASFVRAEPATFSLVKGGWGRRGSTHVHLKAADQKSVESALRVAWKCKAPKRQATQPGKS